MRSLGRALGILASGHIVEAAKERDAFADLIEREDAGVEAVVEIGGEVGDLVGEVDQLRFERRAQVKKILGEFRMSAGQSSRANV